VGKRGVIRDRKVHEEVLAKVGKAALDLGYSVRGLTYSPLRGPRGNIEYFLYLVKEIQSGAGEQQQLDILIEDVVGRAHLALVK